MITCYFCKFANPRAFVGSKSELSFLSASFPSIDANKVFFCSFECYLQQHLENQFFRHIAKEEAEPEDLYAFEEYKESETEAMAARLLSNAGTQNFIKRTGAEVSYKSAPEKMDVEEEITDWADM